jgi:transposase InsO family protein
LLVVVDKFTKWIEAKPIRSLDAATTTKFLKELIDRYGYPHNIITDNGMNFRKSFSSFCREKGIQLDLASVAHPESNGQAERANQMILKGLKPQIQVPLARAAGAWVDELPTVLWSIRTTPNRSTGYTPFFLVNGAKAVLLTDIEHDSPRVVVYDEADNESAMQVTKDLLEEE